MKSRRRSDCQMTRDAKAKRESALARLELRGPSSPRVASASPTSMPIKAVDPETRALIDEALKARTARCLGAFNGPGKP